MSPAELKLLVVSPTIKNWPIVFALAVIVILTGVMGLVLLFLEMRGAVFLIAFGMALLVWPALHSANTEYWVTNLRVVAHRGVFMKSSSEVPIKDIKEIKILRTSLQKTLGVGDVEVVHDGGALSLSGIDEPEKVRDKILSLI